MKKFNIGPIHDIPQPLAVTLCLIFCVLALSAVMVAGIANSQKGDNIKHPVEIYILSNNLAVDARKAKEDLGARTFEKCLYDLHTLTPTMRQANACGYSN